MIDAAQRHCLLAKEFTATFGGEPRIWSRAPGLVDLMGSHTDYNEGLVLTLPVDRDTWVAARPADNDRVSIRSLNLREGDEFQASDPLAGPSPEWARYVVGVVHVLNQAGYRTRGFDAVIHGTLPPGGGLGSSASLECAVGALINAIEGHGIPPLEMAKLCQRAENAVAGVSRGILDQYTAMFGEKDRALLIDCRSLTHESVAIPDGVTVVIADTNVPRELTGSGYGERRAQCEEGARLLGEIYPDVRTLRDVTVARFGEAEDSLPPLVRQRTRFIVEENARVPALARALKENDLEAIGRICAASFAGARDLFEISIRQMEVMVAAMRSAPGIIGARQAGDGFGGCLVAFTDSARTEVFCREVAEDYYKSTGIEPAVYPVSAGPGAGILETAAG